MEHIPAAIIMVIDIAVINLPHRSPPPFNDAVTIIVLLLYRPPRKLTVGWSQPSINPPPPKHLRRVLFDIFVIPDLACLGNTPIEKGHHKQQSS